MRISAVINKKRFERNDKRFQNIFFLPDNKSGQEKYLNLFLSNKIEGKRR